MDLKNNIIVIPKQTKDLGAEPPQIEGLALAIQPNPRSWGWGHIESRDHPWSQSRGKIHDIGIWTNCNRDYHDPMYHICHLIHLASLDFATLGKRRLIWGSLS